MSLARGDYEPARSAHQAGLALFRELNDRSGIASSLFRLANVAEAAGDYASERTLREESLVMFRELGRQVPLAVALTGLGEKQIDFLLRAG